MGGGPAPDPWNGSRIDPRDKLPSLSAGQWLVALRHVARTAVPVVVQNAAAGIEEQATVARMDAFLAQAKGKYQVNGVEVAVAPFFRMSNGLNGASEAKKSQVFAVTGSRSKAFDLAVHRAVYGRATPEELRLVTQALIDRGKLDEVRRKYDSMPYDEFSGRGMVARPLDDANAIKLLQWEYGIGIDCAGYVQLAFLDVHGGTRESWGFKSIGNENLSQLKGNGAFERATTPVGAGPGDLIFLKPPPGDRVGHTVLVRGRTVLTPEQAGTLSKAHPAYAGPGDRIHVIEVHGSWGAGDRGNLDVGGLQARQFLYNEATGTWADVHGGEVVPQPNGPYNGHAVEGIYSPRR
jgi:hypothetical protein